jgi:hypothetical protein
MITDLDALQANAKNIRKIRIIPFGIATILDIFIPPLLISDY